jgi:hypothetical protein
MGSDQSKAGGLTSLSRPYRAPAPARLNTVGNGRAVRVWLEYPLRALIAFGVPALCAWLYSFMFGETAGADRRCAMVCYLYLPVMLGAACAISIRLVVLGLGKLQAVRSSRGPAPLGGMVIGQGYFAILGGVVLGTTLACLLTGPVCRMMCAMYGASCCARAGMTGLTSVIFTPLSSVFAYAVCFTGD